jgi:hypothetical protein
MSLAKFQREAVLKKTLDLYFKAADNRLTQ